MLKRLFPAFLACAMVVSIALPAKPQSAPTVFASQLLGGVGQAVTLDLGGQTTCRAALVPSGGFVGTLTAGIEAVGDSTFQGMTLYDDNGLPVTTVTASGGYYTLYPKSAGTVEIAIATWSNGGMNVYLNCSPAGGPPPKRDALGNESVTFPTSQPVTVNGAPTPIPTLPSVIPTSTPIAAGTAAPIWAYLGIQCGTAGLWCPASGSGSNAAGSSRNALNIIPCNPIATLCAPPTPYPTPSAGAALGGAALPVTDPCLYVTGIVLLSPGNVIQHLCDQSGRALVTTPAPAPTDAAGRVSVTTPSPLPTDAAGRVSVTTPSPLPTDVGGRLSVSTPPPQPQVTPLCPVGLYPCGFPTPMPTIAPTPAPTASAGAPLPPGAPWNWALFACPYNGYNNATAGAPPNPSIGNAIACQANIDGSILTSTPQINAKATVSANGTYLSENLDGEASCRIKMNPGVGTSGVVNVVDSSGFSFAGPYTVSGITNTATFQLVTPLYVTTDALSVVVTSFAGANTIAITLTCSSAPGVESVYQGVTPWKDVLTDASGTPWTSASPFPGPSPIPYQSFAGLILKTVASDTGGTAYTGASPMPVTTPAPVATAASPAPAGVPASGYNAAGLAAPVICTQEASGSISTTAAVAIAAVAAKKIYVCAYSFSIIAGASSGNAQFSFASSTCLSPTNVGIGAEFFASSSFPTTIVIGSGIGLVMKPSNPNQALCIKASTAITGGTYDVIYENF
jgi:hypothetical protein